MALSLLLLHNQRNFQCSKLLSINFYTENWQQILRYRIINTSEVFYTLYNFLKYKNLFEKLFCNLHTSLAERLFKHVLGEDNGFINQWKIFSKNKTDPLLRRAWKRTVPDDLCLLVYALRLSLGYFKVPNTNKIVFATAIFMFGILAVGNTLIRIKCSGAGCSSGSGRNFLSGSHWKISGESAATDFTGKKISLLRTMP